MTSRRAYQFELRPTAGQLVALERMANARRFAYNWGLARWRAFHEETGGTIKLRALMRELTRLKRRPHGAWLREVDSQLLQQALFDLRQAYRNFFERRAGYPRFKSRKDDPQRFRIPQRVQVRGSRVYVPKVGWVRARISRDLPDEFKSATFKRDATGKWFVALVEQFECPPPPRLPTRPRVVGVDLGIHEFAVLSTGERIAHPRFERGASRRMRQAHRAVTRKRPGSRNRERARVRLSRLYRRTANQRQDFLHKLSTRLVATHDVVAIEDLCVTGLARTKLARAVGDSGFREFRRQLEYKAEWNGKRIHTVDRFFPSSKLCGECGVVNHDLSRTDRTWICSCGAVLDRDLNAANNLRESALVAAGRTDTENACGARVRPPTEAVGDEAGIR
ncbi:MAG: RNA-guided endonuclease InsQ/TnpB family protein [Solirubrobacterales bacterium]